MAMYERLDDIQPPATIPTGKWVFEIDDCGISNKGGNRKAWFNLTPVETVDTNDPDLQVDPEDFETYSAEGLEDQTVFLSYDLDDRARRYEFKQTMLAIGAPGNLEISNKGLKELAGIKFAAVVSHDPNDKQPDRPWVRLRSFAQVE